MYAIVYINILNLCNYTIIYNITMVWKYETVHIYGLTGNLFRAAAITIAE